MAKVEEVSLIHEHPLLPFTRFVLTCCSGCDKYGYIYGGYRCNELGCSSAVFHKECGESLPEINHSSHPDHPLKLFNHGAEYSCSLCGGSGSGSRLGYSCSAYDFKLDLVCATRGSPPPILANPSVHEHLLELCHDREFDCKACNDPVYEQYACVQCKLHFHVECVKYFPEAYHTSHPKHALKFISREAASTYVDDDCILCGKKFHGEIHHCDVCNFSICRECMRCPQPLVVVSLTTHQHQLHLVPRPIIFTCNACGTLGDRSPYFCLPCNFMIHRECIDLPRLIHINRHDHRIFYTPRLGHGEWKCKVCRNEVDWYHGAYTCAKCPSFAVHALCATRTDVWDMVELEGTPEEPEESEPFEVIDGKTIKHFLHDHNLRINKDGEILQETILCEACAFQICSESFYSCEQCSFTLHTKCANLPRKKRHVYTNLPLVLETSRDDNTSFCGLCFEYFTGFRYADHHHHYPDKPIDVRCSSFSEPFVHGSHPHPLYYVSYSRTSSCSGCSMRGKLTCDECDFSLCFKCAFLPQEVVRHRYDDHPLSLSYGETSVNGEYWCEACETKLNPKRWFYTCNDCGVVLHISCIVGDFTYIMPGRPWLIDGNHHREIAPNTSVCRAFCTRCSMRCILPSILKGSKDGIVEYFCTLECFRPQVW